MRRAKIHEKASYLADAVFSASDGIVTTFAIVAGSAGASLSTSVVLILGFANLFADGFSMAAGNYLGAKSEIEFEKAKGSRTDGEGSPLVHGGITFAAFNIAGLIPLTPFLFLVSSPFVSSAFLVGAALFLVGVMRSYYTKRSIFKSGTEMLLVGGFAALAAFLTGEVLKKAVG